VLEVLGDPQRITHVGANGIGYLTKLLVNLLWFGHAVATAETLLPARASGIDLDVLRQALAGSARRTFIGYARSGAAGRRRRPLIARLEGHRGRPARHRDYSAALRVAVCASGQ
jgi:hypothetical protein